MRLKLAWPLIVLALAMLLSCKKDANVKTEPNVPLKMLSRIIELDNDNKVTFTTFQYDERKRLIGSIKGSEQRTSLSYNGDKLYSSELVFGATRNQYTVTYLADKPSLEVLKIYINGTLAKEYTFSPIYTGDKLTEMHSKLDGVVFSIQKFQYAGDNIVRTETTQDGRLIKSEMSYDDKKNKFYNAPLLYRLYLDSEERYIKNNVLKDRRIYDNGTYVDLINTYTYDTEGFPVTHVRKSVSSTGTDHGTYKYTYEYVNL
jgi:hypothetical protein